MREILKGSSSYFISAVASNASTFVVALFVSWYLGKEGIGLLSIGLTIVLFGSLLSDLGINSFAIREYAGTTRSRLMSLRSLVILRFVVAVFVAACFALAAALFIPVSQIGVLALSSALLIIFRSASGVLESFLKATMQQRRFFILTVSMALAQVTLVLIALSTGSGIGIVFFILAGVELSRCAVMIIMLRGDLAPSAFQADDTTNRVKQTLLQTAPFAAMAVLSTITDRADLFLLAGMVGPAEAGVYAAADRFLMVGNLVEFALFASLLPILSSLASRSHINELTLRTGKVIVLIAAAGSAALFITAPLLIRITFHFPESIHLLRILALALPGIVANSLIRVALFSVRREKSVMFIFALTAVGNILLNFMLIPRFGAVGSASVAVLTVYAMTAMYSVLYVKSMIEPSTVELSRAAVQENV